MHPASDTILRTAIARLRTTERRPDRCRRGSMNAPCGSPLRSCRYLFRLQLFAPELTLFRIGSVLFFLKVQLPVWCSRDTDDGDDGAVLTSASPARHPRPLARCSSPVSRTALARQYEAATCASPRSTPTASDRARSTSVPRLRAAA
jgi:hypothetical protein